ncbi:MAG: ATP-binding protein [Flavobacteriales bacterium]|nr:ATP-binding protein [Flavobacteriales bacterium]
MRIAIVGPESSGKTTLTEQLMFRGIGGLIGDATREYLYALERPYTEEDLLEMAQGHAQWFGDAAGFGEEHHQALHGKDPIARRAPRKPMFFDTDILNIKIWSQEKYGRVHPEIERLVRVLHYDLRLLCRPDIPWKPDPQRENPHDRDRLFAVWEREMKSYGFPYVIIEGGAEERVQKAVEVVEALMRGAAS